MQIKLKRVTSFFQHGILPNKISFKLYMHSTCTFTSPTFYDRIKSYYPSSQLNERNENSDINNDHLSILTDKHLHNSSNVIKLKHEYKIIYLIGISHHSRLSALRVISLCSDAWPDTIFMELCDKRLKQLRLKMALQSPLSNKFRTIIHKISNYSLFAKYKHGPFIEGIRFADKHNLNIECGDINSDTTMKQLQNALKANQKPFHEIINEKQYVKYVFLNQVINEYMMHVKFVFNIGNDDLNIWRRERNPMVRIEKSRKEANESVSKYSKITYNILHEQRDKYMVHNLHESKGNVIVAIVGIGHLDGIIQYWNDLQHIHNDNID
eukprot:434135_1